MERKHVASTHSGEMANAERQRVDATAAIRRVVETATSTPKVFHVHMEKQCSGAEK